MAAVAVLGAFTIADLHFDWRSDSTPNAAQLSMAIAFYATAIAVIAAVCFFLDSLRPAPPPRPLPKMPIWVGLFYVVSGGLARDIGDAIDHAVAIQLTYLSVWGVFSTIALIAAIFARRYFPGAKWFAMINGPGTMLLLIIATVFVFDY
jgi:hypothetical protein